MSAPVDYDIQQLRVDYRTRTGNLAAVRDISIRIAAGETVALVGESGSGKSSVAGAIINALPDNARARAESLRLGEADLRGISERQWRRIRGRRIGMVAQDPGSSLNPVKDIGHQVAEALTVHGVPAREARARVTEILARAGMPDPEYYADLYPHQLSGGLQQRALIAIAVANEPGLIIADEPTSALDVTTQRHVLDELAVLSADRGSSVLLITRDLGVALDRADRILVMKEGRIVDRFRPSEQNDPERAPYTAELFAAAPGLRAASGGLPRERPALTTAGRDDVILRAEGLVKVFPGAREGSAAVDGVSFAVRRGQTLALVGESGSGKSTTARMALGLVAPSQGSVVFTGADEDAIRVDRLPAAQRRGFRRKAQFVYQNPYGSLNPLFSVARIIAEPLTAFQVGTKAERTERIQYLLDAVALPAALAENRPAELSGGQRQRVAIARALALEPELLVLDEPVSALDVRVQAQVLELLRELQSRLGLSYLLISHDLAVVRDVADEVLVMASGTVVESGRTADVFEHPQAPLTRALLDAIPGRIAPVA